MFDLVHTAPARHKFQGDKDVTITADFRSWTAFAASFLLSCMLIAASASAHEVRPTIATLTLAPDRTISLNVDANVEALLAQIGPEHEDTDEAPTAGLYDELRQLPPSELEARLRAFLPEWLAAGPLKVEDVPLMLDVGSISIPPVDDVSRARESQFVLTGTLPEGAETFVWAYPATYGSSVLRVERSGAEVQGRFFAAGAVSEPLAIGTVAERAWYETAWDYGVIGFTHILPKGLDHILFVLGLFLLSPKFRPLLWQVTAFTVAHTITIALGIYGVVNISPSIVEPIIALSIVYVAVENIVTKELHPWRPAIVFVFGLLHGLGFAGILSEIGLPREDYVLGLVSFNIGVEAGQLTVIALAFLAVGWAMNKPWYRRAITIPASVLIGLVGAYWFVERTVL